MSYEPHNQGRCAACGGFLEAEIRGSVRVLEFSRIFIRDLAKIDRPVAAEILASGGYLALHPDCEHPVEDYFPRRH